MEIAELHQINDAYMELPLESEIEVNISSQHLMGLITIIQKYSLEDVVGVFLLHKHFDIAEDQVLLREIRHCTERIRPVSIEFAASADCIASTWRFQDTYGTTPTVVELQYSLGDIDVDIPKAFFQEFRDVLCQQGLLERVGLTRLGLPKSHDIPILEITDIDTLEIIRIYAESITTASFTSVWNAGPVYSTFSQYLNCC